VTPPNIVRAWANFHGLGDPPQMMKLCCRCGFQPHSKRQDAASTVVFHVNQNDLTGARA